LRNLDNIIKKDAKRWPCKRIYWRKCSYRLRLVTTKLRSQPAADVLLAYLILLATLNQKILWKISRSSTKVNFLLTSSVSYTLLTSNDWWIKKGEKGRRIRRALNQRPPRQTKCQSHTNNFCNRRLQNSDLLHQRRHAAFHQRDARRMFGLRHRVSGIDPGEQIVALETGQPARPTAARFEWRQKPQDFQLASTISKAVRISLEESFGNIRIYSAITKPACRIDYTVRVECFRAAVATAR